MTMDYSDHYSWSGWFEGSDCEPPEPGKEWLEIEEDGEEYAVIVLRADTFADSDSLAYARAERELRAIRITEALNALTS